MGGSRERAEMPVSPNGNPALPSRNAKLPKATDFLPPGSQRLLARGGSKLRSMYYEPRGPQPKHQTPPSCLGLLEVGYDPFQWRCSACADPTANRGAITRTIRSGSIFESHVITLKQFAQLMFLFTTEPRRTHETVANEVGCSVRTVINIYHEFRWILQRWANHYQNAQGNNMLGGPNTIVEVDESKLFRAKHNRGRGLRVQRDWIFGMIERGTRRVWMETVDNRDHATLANIICAHVADGTHILSDGWMAYRALANDQVYPQYTHSWVNHKRHFVDPNDPTIHTQNIEAEWKQLKDHLKRLKTSDEDSINEWVAEYLWRRTTGQVKGWKVFTEFVKVVRETYAV